MPAGIGPARGNAGSSAIGPDRFRRFAAVDWSGAKGEQLPGIAVALCGTGSAAPRLVDPPGRHWSRAAVRDWILAEAAAGDLLVGLDLGASLAFADRGAFFPGWDRSPADARSLWRLVERLCADDAHLGAGSFVDHAEASRHFRRHGGRAGDLFPPGAGRFRVTEAESRAQGLAHPVSNFNLVGAAQVGKSSLTGMRMLGQLDGRVALWPFDPWPDSGSAVVEIYTSIAAVAAGARPGRTKLRDADSLDAALARLGSVPHAPLAAYDDHRTDALLTAAWLRTAAGDARLRHPARLTSDIARTEGWTFGVA